MRTVVPPEAVLRTAQRVFLATGSLEMRALARELGIGRATLYRWTGSRDELLSDVLLALALANLRGVERDVDTPAGALRVCEVHDLHLRRVSGNPSFRRFLRAEPDVASRLLLDVNGKVHRGVTRALADFLRRQEEESTWRAPLGVDTFAHVVSRMSETYIYADLIARGEPETLTPDLVLRLMLGLPVEHFAAP
jgi:AcrR family transcriptional regulator